MSARAFVRRMTFVLLFSTSLPLSAAAQGVGAISGTIADPSGGVLLSCSCTGLVSEEDFLMALRAAATEANIELQILGVFGAPGDHPWAIRTPEGRYLKAVYCRVE